METARLTEWQQVARAVSNTFSRVAEALETPVHVTIALAAGGHHQLVSPHEMRR